MITKEELDVRNAWDENGKYISGYYIHSFSDIRWARSKNKLVLQKYSYVKVKFSKALWIYGEFKTEDSRSIWLDVHIVGKNDKNF